MRAKVAVHAARVDRLLDLYYGHFCDSGPGRDLLVSADDAMLPESEHVIEAMLRAVETAMEAGWG